jgi:hypothetical protein
MRKFTDIANLNNISTNHRSMSSITRFDHRFSPSRFIQQLVQQNEAYSKDLVLGLWYIVNMEKRMGR